MNIETDHSYNETATPLQRAVIHLTLDSTTYDLDASDAKEIAESLIHECDAVQAHNITAYFARSANTATRGELAERSRQWARDVAAQHEAEATAERIARSETASERKRARYLAEKAAADAGWAARAERVRAEQQGAKK